MARVLITGLAGTGKSMVIRELEQRGHRAIDTSGPEWSQWERVREAGSNADGPRDEWVWREDRISDLLAAHESADLFLGGCASNQGRFHDKFDKIVLLTASTSRMLERLEPRWDLRMAGDRFERYLVLQSVERVLPRLRALAGIEIDTTNRGIAEVTDLILEHVGTGLR